MAKIDPTQPNVINVHKELPDIGTRMAKNLKETEALSEQLQYLLTKFKYLESEREYFWAEIKRTFKDELSVIDPENKGLTCDVIEDILYVTKMKEKKLSAIDQLLSALGRR